MAKETNNIPDGDGEDGTDSNKAVEDQNQFTHEWDEELLEATDMITRVLRSVPFEDEEPVDFLVRQLPKGSRILKKTLFVTTIEGETLTFNEVRVGRKKQRDSDWQIDPYPQGYMVGIANNLSVDDLYLHLDWENGGLTEILGFKSTDPQTIFDRFDLDKADWRYVNAQGARFFVDLTREATQKFISSLVPPPQPPAFQIPSPIETALN